MRAESCTHVVGKVSRGGVFAPTCELPVVERFGAPVHGLAL
jgi:hypothetical protein